MRVVNRQTFLALPVGTVYAKFGDTEGSDGHFYFGEVRIKDDPRGDNDWYSIGFTDGFKDADCTEQWVDAMDRMVNGGEAELNFDTVDSDGLFDAKQLFAIFSDADVAGLVARLKEAQRALAIATEAGTATATEIGVVHEGADPKGIAQKEQQHD